MDDKNKINPQNPSLEQYAHSRARNFLERIREMGSFAFEAPEDIHLDSGAIEPPTLTQEAAISTDTSGKSDEDGELAKIAGEYVDGMQQQFATEHSIKRPHQLKSSISNNSENHQTTTTTTPEKYQTTTTTTSRSTDIVKERSLDEKIEIEEQSVKNERGGERRTKKDSRVRHNFDTDFHIATMYKLQPGDFAQLRFDITKEEYAPFFETITNNRKLLYGYIQHHGMGVVDDTGRSPYQGDVMDSFRRGFFMLPAEIEHTDFFAFEDAIRDIYPFTNSETKLHLLRAMKEDPGATLASLDLACPPDKMRELVDSLALDPRFTHLFKKAEVIRAARKEKPRADIQEKATEHAEDSDELPVYTPPSGKVNKWGRS